MLTEDAKKLKLQKILEESENKITSNELGVDGVDIVDENIASDLPIVPMPLHSIDEVIAKTKTTKKRKPGRKKKK